MSEVQLSATVYSADQSSDPYDVLNIISGKSGNAAPGWGNQNLEDLLVDKRPVEPAVAEGSMFYIMCIN